MRSSSKRPNQPSKKDGVVVLRDRPDEVVIKCQSSHPVSKLVQNSPDWTISFSIDNDGAVKLYFRTDSNALKKGQHIGYRCDDGVMTMAKVMDIPSARKVTVKCLNGGPTPEMTIESDSDRLYQESVENIKKQITRSHLDVYDKWIIMLDAKYKNESPFRYDTFREEIDIKMCQIHPSLLFTIQQQHEAKHWREFNHHDILRSLLCWSASLICTQIDCHSQPKLLCQCPFKEYLYELLMILMQCAEDEMTRKVESKYSLLIFVCFHVHRRIHWLIQNQYRASWKH